MPAVPDIGGDASSNLVRGTGTQTVTYTLPATPGQKVTSVVATITNGAASSVRPSIVIRDVSGQVIATNRQADSIPAADTGTATFALRLSDNGGGAIRYGANNQGNWLHIDADETSPAMMNVGGVSGAWSVGINGETLAAFGATGAAAQTWLTSEDFLKVQSGGNLFVDSDGNLEITATDMTITLAGDASVEAGTITELSTAGDYWVGRSGGSQVVFDDTSMYVKIWGTGFLRVRDASNNPIFEVREDGSLHGKTGQSLTFDL